MSGAFGMAISGIAPAGMSCATAVADIGPTSALAASTPAASTARARVNRDAGFDTSFDLSFNMESPVALRADGVRCRTRRGRSALGAVLDERTHPDRIRAAGTGTKK